MKEPRWYQAEDARRLAGGEVLGLSSDPGTGKTLTALLAAEQAGARHLLIMCPAIAVGVWLDEIGDHGRWIPFTALDPIPAPGDAPFSARVVGYEHAVATRAVRALVADGAPYDVMICDEAHYLKNPAAQRTRLVYGSFRNAARRVWPLSGTFILNHPGELWPHLNALAPARIDFMGYSQFIRIYCRVEEKRVSRRRTVQKIVGANAAMAADLKARIDGLFARRRATIETLPPLNFVLRPLTAPPPRLDPEDRALARLIMERANAGDAAFLERSQEEPNFARIRARLAEAKVESAAAWVNDILEETHEKVLLFAWHRAAIEGLEAALGRWRPLVVWGGTPAKQRTEKAAAFQTNPERRLWIGQIQASGVAVTLTAATRVVFLEQAFTPSLNFQAAKRAHRIGQTRSVLVETLYLRDSVDEPVLRLLNRKSREIATFDEAV